MNAINRFISKKIEISLSDLILKYVFFGFFIILIQPENIYNMFFNPNLKITINQDIEVKTNFRKERIDDYFYFQYENKAFFPTCSEINIPNLCQENANTLNIKKIVIYPFYKNYQKTEMYAFIYEMDYLDKNNQLQHYQASKAFEDANKISIGFKLMAYVSTIGLLWCFYLTYLYCWLKKNGFRQPEKD